MRWPAAALTLAARLTGRSGSKPRASSATAAQQPSPTPAPITGKPSNAAGSHGSPMDALTAREEAIAQAKRTRRHDHRSKARELTLACLRRN